MSIRKFTAIQFRRKMEHGLNQPIPVLWAPKERRQLGFSNLTCLHCFLKINDM
jgi:hypothetical protein